MEHQQQVVLFKDSLDSCDPHGYCSSSAAQEPFKSPSKRSFLSECIRQIYIMNGRIHALPLIPSPIVYNRTKIWGTINGLMRPPPPTSSSSSSSSSQLSCRRALLQRVKRQLFRVPKQRTRKQLLPQKQTSTRTECSHFKTMRSLIGLRRIRRNYLDAARDMVLQTTQRGTTLKRKHDGDCSALNIEAHEGSFQVSSQTISQICKYHKNMARPHPLRERTQMEQQRRDRNTEACRLSRRAKKLEELLVVEQYHERMHMNQKMLEESIRSIYYMKALLNLMVDHEENLYI